MKVKQKSAQHNLSFNSYWLEFVKTCLRPLVQILVKHKVEFKSVNNLLRELYVEEGESYIRTNTSNSRGKISSIAHQTGLDRREVSALLKSKNSNANTEVARSREANILEHWKYMPPFCDHSNNPIPLKRSGKGLTFETLCQRFGKNISHGPILESLLEAKCVKIIENKVHFVNKFYIPSSGVSKKITQIAAASIKRLVTTIHHNFYNENDPIFQRNLYSIRIKKELVPVFKKRVNQMIRKIYLEIIIPEFDQIESEIETLESRNSNQPIGLGIFYFQD